MGTQCSNVTSVIGGQLDSPKYTFKGYKIVNIKGTAQEGSNVFDVWGPGKAVTTGVFNYPNGDNPIVSGSVKADSIPHSLPDQLFNPRGLGFGFDPAGFDFGNPAAFIRYPADRLDNYFSFGGITFDIGHLDTPGDYTTTFTFKEPYQLFTVAYDSTSTGTGESLKAGNYAGCPGSCKGAVVPAPSPLPFLGVGAAFGFSRKLRKRIKCSETPEMMSTIA